MLYLLYRVCPVCQEYQELSGIFEILAKSQENISKIFHISHLLGKFEGNVRNFWFCLVVSTFKSYVDINFPRDFEILGCCPVAPVLPHGEKVLL